MESRVLSMRQLQLSPRLLLCSLLRKPGATLDQYGNPRKLTKTISHKPGARGGSVGCGAQCSSGLSSGADRASAAAPHGASM